LGAALLPSLLSCGSKPSFTYAIKILAYAGSGVLLSTGFIHLLLPAQENLSSPCLSETWLNGYPSWAFLFCVITIAILQILDFFFCQCHDPLEPSPPEIAFPAHNGHDEIDPEIADAGTKTPACCNNHTKHGSKDNAKLSSNDDDATILSKRERSKLAALALSETSIVVHSVIIGVALGVTGQDEFVPLFVALTFHQVMEGLALGSAAVHANISKRSQAIMAVLYASSTPIGVGIGMAIRSSFNTDTDATGLMVTGIFDSIGAGMLIFLSLGDHMNALKHHAHWLHSQSIVIKIACVLAFVVGNAVMLAIGYWA
jgi:zinc transporter 1/2/3